MDRIAKPQFSGAFLNGAGRSGSTLDSVRPLGGSSARSAFCLFEDWRINGPRLLGLVRFRYDPN